MFGVVKDVYSKCEGCNNLEHKGTPIQNYTYHGTEVYSWWIKLKSRSLSISSLYWKLLSRIKIQGCFRKCIIQFIFFAPPRGAAEIKNIFLID